MKSLEVLLQEKYLCEIKKEEKGGKNKKWLEKIPLRI